MMTRAYRKRRFSVRFGLRFLLCVIPVLGSACAVVRIALARGSLEESARTLASRLHADCESTPTFLGRLLRPIGVNIPPDLSLVTFEGTNYAFDLPAGVTDYDILGPLIYDPPMSDQEWYEFLEAIKALPSPPAIMVNGLTISDEALREVGTVRRLTTLSLRATKITDSSLATIAQLKQLRSLNLADTKISDDGVRHLEALRSLLEIDLSRTRVTDQGAARLQAALPCLRITR